MKTCLKDCGVFVINKSYYILNFRSKLNINYYILLLLNGKNFIIDFIHVCISIVMFYILFYFITFKFYFSNYICLFFCRSSDGDGQERRGRENGLHGGLSSLSFIHGAS